MRVNLVDIVYGLEVQSDDHLFYVNRHTGIITHIVEKFLYIAQEEKDIAVEMEKWEKEEFYLAKTVVNNRDDYILLPGMPPIHDIMIQFSRTVEDIEQQRTLLQTIQQEDTFKPFRSLLKRYELLDDWYGFREAVYIEVARMFCEKHQLNYEQ